MAGKRIMPRRHARVVLRISSRAAGGFADTLGRCAPVSPAAIMTPHTRALTAAGISSSALTRAAGLLDLAPSGEGVAAADEPPASPVESAISADERLADQQKAALIAVYRSMLRS